MRFFLPILALTSLAGLVSAKQPTTPNLPANTRLAIVGDSITEQKQYSKYMEAYLLACTGRTDIKCFQFGWSGETAAGFSKRIENEFSAFLPTVATFCFGMNDGRYTAYTDAIGSAYEAPMRAMLTTAPKLGVTKIVAGSPGAVDTKFYTKIPPAVYNDNLSRLGDIDKKLAGEFQQTFTNVHTTMIDAMAKAKAALGDDYDVCGRDGVHPRANGHLLMAQAYLKALGCDGNIGDITMDMRGGAGQATEGHKVIGGTGATLELESTTWPFCFDGDPKSPGSNRSILPFCTFNQDLNRLTLKVKNLDGPKASVTWGTETKEFTKEQLTQGINLAAEFSKTPFDEAFGKFIQSVGTKQSFETIMIKNMITNFRLFAGEAQANPELANAFSTLKKGLMARQEQLDTEVRKNLVPVKHSLKIEAVK